MAVFRARWWLACAISVGLFAWNFSMFYIPGKGFTYLLTIGDRRESKLLPQLKSLDLYISKDSAGYDAVSYSQIAVNPDLRDPDLANAVDNLPYRARRILFCWTAWLAGSGDPGQVLLAYSLQNVIAWVLLAILLFRWFRQETLGDFFRWFATLFSFGMFFSIRCSLVDGPSLLLIAAGIALAESGKPWLSAILLGISGLGKETNIGAAVAMELPGRFSLKAWLPVVARGLVVVLPVVLWYGYLAFLFGTKETVGAQNFSAPFVAYIGKWRSTIAELTGSQSGIGFWNLAVLVSLTTQFLFFACRPKPKDRWWRLGAVMSLLMLVVGPAVWEGYPSASARVLLPMLLAFNIAVPRGWKWAVVLVLGNISILASPSLFNPPPRENFRVTGPAALLASAENGKFVEMDFKDGWFEIERSRLEYWRWSSGSASVVFTNPHRFPIRIRSEFDLRSREPRDARIELGGKVLWEGNVDNDTTEVRLEFDLPPGETRWLFATKMPAFPAGGIDPRVLAFSLRNLKVEIVGRADR